MKVAKISKITQERGICVKQVIAQLGIFTGFPDCGFPDKNDKHMLKYLKLFGGENGLQKYSTDFLIWITSLSKKNFNLENHILEIQGDP